MLKGKNKTIQDYIIELLAKGNQDIQGIETYIKKFRSITRPAIYDQLRKLRNDGIILKNKTRYFLSREWINSISNLFTSFDAPILQEGESVSYQFKSLEQADAYWKHVFPLYDSLYENMPICIYNKHCFWIHLEDRKESEEFHYKSYRKQKRTAYFLVGDNTGFDLSFKKKYQDSFFKINTQKVKGIKDKDNITIIGDIIINSQIPQALLKKIDFIYQDNNINASEKELLINKAVKANKKVNFKIERNNEKAKKLKKIITKDFILPYSHKEKLLK